MSAAKISKANKEILRQWAAFERFGYARLAERFRREPEFATVIERLSYLAKHLSDEAFEGTVEVARREWTASGLALLEGSQATTMP